MKNQILIVDDVEMNRELLTDILSDEYVILTASNGVEAVDIMEKHHDDIVAVLLDIVMPEMDGYEVLYRFRKKNWLGLTSVLVISGEKDKDSERRCLDLGAFDFIGKPFDPNIVKKRVENAVELVAYRKHLEKKVESQTRSISRYANRLKAMNDNIISVLGSVVESRNLESGEHIYRVQTYSKILGTEIMKRYPEYKLDAEKVHLITSASALHDLGKISIPDSVLLKPGKLTDEEFALMKEHSNLGYEIIQNIGRAWDKKYAKVSGEIAHYHHERWDGRGYPAKLKGDEIPIAAQIVSIADVYDALVNERCYKKAFPKDKAFEMIMNGECGIFSPKLLDCFKRVRRKFEKA